MSLLRRIQNLMPETCPNCGASEAYTLADGAPRCGECGHTLLPPDAIPAKPAPAHPAITDAELEAALFSDEPDIPTPQPSIPQGGFRTPSGRDLSRYRSSLMIRDKDGSTPWIVVIFTSAMNALDHQKYDETLKHLKRCLEDNPEFIDALLWLGRLEDEPAVRMAHIKRILALQPSNGEAMREFMILNGDIDPDQTFNDFTEAEVRQAHGVTANVRSLKCPRCGSPNLSDDDASETILICDSCGYHFDKPKHTSNMQSLTAALIKRRSQSVVWVVGSRILKCNGCGAERTLSGSQLSSACPFCGSHQVVEQDALGTLSQPESLVQFRVSKQQALEQVKKATTSGMEKFKGFFVDNRINRIDISGVFLPFWLFDAMVDITHSYERVENNAQKGAGMFRLGGGDMGGLGNMMGGMSHKRLITDKLNDAALNLPIPAFKQPPTALVMRVCRYDYGQAVDYSPDYIAQHAAELYSIDFDKASMDARGTISEMMRRKHHRDDGAYKTINIATMMTQASFRLLLLPMWAVTIFEKDGDVRPVLVNGQTGQVALGKSQKPKGQT